MNKNIKFKVMPMIWAKRRSETKKELEIESFEVIGFELKKGHVCKIQVKYLNLDEINLQAKVSYNCSYNIVDGKVEEFNPRWVVQGIDHKGNNIQLKVITS